MNDIIQLEKVQFAGPTSLAGRAHNTVGRRECEVLRFRDGFVEVQRKGQAEVNMIPLHNVKHMVRAAELPKPKKRRGRPPKTKPQELPNEASEATASPS